MKLKGESDSDLCGLTDLLGVRIIRYPQFVLLPIWQLRDRFSAYPAAYVVLPEPAEAMLVPCSAKRGIPPGLSSYRSTCSGGLRRFSVDHTPTR